MNRRHYVHFYNEKGCSFSASFRQITDEWFMQQLVQYSWFYGCGGLPNITTMFSEYCSDGGEHCLSMHPQARSVASGRGGGWKPYCFLQQFFFLKTYRKWIFGSVYIFFSCLESIELGTEHASMSEGLSTLFEWSAKISLTGLFILLFISWPQGSGRGLDGGSKFIII